MLGAGLLVLGDVDAGEVREGKARYDLADLDGEGTMTLQILLLKRDSDQEPKESDLHPPPSDLLGRFPVFGGSGSFDAVVLAEVPHCFSFATRNRPPMDGTIYLVKDALPIVEPPIGVEEGVMRW